jgi:hypothetical protein
MLMPDVRITNQIEDARYNPDRTVARHVRVEFFVGTHGPFMLEIPKDDIVAGRRDELVENYARALRVT